MRMLDAQQSTAHLRNQTSAHTFPSLHFTLFFCLVSVGICSVCQTIYDQSVDNHSSHQIPFPHATNNSALKYAAVNAPLFYINLAILSLYS